MDKVESTLRFIGWWIINIDILYIVILLLGGALLLIRSKKWGKRFVFKGCCGLSLLAIVPVGLWVLVDLENRFPHLYVIPGEATGMILLGGSFDRKVTLERHETSYNYNGGRLIHYIELIKKYPHLKLVFTGTPFEVETTQRELRALGIDPSLVAYESNSKDTKENALNTAKLIRPRPEEKWVLVTSAYHMPRSVGLFRKAGINVIPYPVDYHTSGAYDLDLFLGLKRNLEAWHVSTREWMGMVINYLMGRSDHLYPGVNG